MRSKVIEIIKSRGILYRRLLRAYPNFIKKVVKNHKDIFIKLFCKYQHSILTIAKNSDIIKMQ